MINTWGLTHIALAVADLNRASRFYRDVFGAVEVYRQATLVQVQIPAPATSSSSSCATPTRSAPPAASRTSASASRIRPTSTRPRAPCKPPAVR